METDGRWVTMRGARVFIRTGQSPMDAFIRRQTQKNVFEKLKEKYPNGEVTTANGIERIDLPINAELKDNYIYGKDYTTTTQEELKNLPVRMTTFGNYGTASSIYKNQRELIKDIEKTYGGFREYTDNGNIKYSISSEGEIGEFYLYRDSFAKGGWVWKDANDNIVKGYEYKGKNN